MSTAWRLLDSSNDAMEAWRTVLRASPDATFFHTIEWAEAFCSAMPEWQPDPVAIEFTDGNLAVLPMLRRTGTETRQSMAPYVYGGPLFLRDLDESQWEEVGRIPTWYSDLVLYDNPFTEARWEPEGVVRWKIHTHVVDLTPGIDKVHGGCRRMIRQHLRAAEAAGVSVTIARSLREVEQYYDGYVDSIRRWKENATPHYPLQLFHELFRLQEDNRGVRLWVASIGGQVVSGVLVFYRGEHSVAWHAATHADYLSLNASPLTHMTAIRAACADGLRWYDFNPSGHLRGVEFFKESFGAVRRRFNMYHSPTFTRELQTGPLAS